MLGGIYIAFRCALAPRAMVVGSSQEERAIKAGVSAQEGWKTTSHLGDTCGLCPSCSKYLLFISTAALLLPKTPRAVGTVWVPLVHEKPSLQPLLPWAPATLPSAVASWCSSSLLLLSPETASLTPPRYPQPCLCLSLRLYLAPAQPGLGESHTSQRQCHGATAPGSPGKMRWVPGPSGTGGVFLPPPLSSLSLSWWSPKCPTTAGSLGWSNKPKAKAHMICVAVTGVSLLGSEAPRQPVLATRSPLFLNVLPRHWRNTLVAPEFCHQSSVELLFPRPLGSFPN